MNTSNKLGPNPETDKILSWDSTIVEYKSDTDVDKILKYIKSLENKWGWNYLTTDSWGDPYINSDKIIAEIEELIKIKI